jgi:hypothetical protein
LIHWYLSLVWVKYMSNSYCPKLCGATVWFKPNAFMVADDLDGLWAEIHFLNA